MFPVKLIRGKKQVVSFSVRSKASTVLFKQDEEEIMKSTIRFNFRFEYFAKSIHRCKFYNEQENTGLR